jgi:hypothetical protein
VWLPPALVVAAVCAAAIPYLSGTFDPNPMLQFSGLATELHHGLLGGRDTIDPNAGFTAQALGHLAASDWLRGRPPWWNPFEGLGAPLAGEMQSMGLMLPLVLLLKLVNGQVLLFLILDVISALSTYWLLRRLAVSRWVSTGCAIAFGLNGTVAWLHNAAGYPVCFLPLLLLGLELVRESARAGRRGAGGWALVAVALALSVYAGFPETAYLDGLLALVWALARLGGLDTASARRYLLRLAGSVAAGALLAAPALVSFADYVGKGYLGANANGFSRSHDPVTTLGGIFFPYIYGPIDGHAAQSSHAVYRFWSSAGGYLSVALVALAVVGLLGGRAPRSLRVALGVSALVLIGRVFAVPPVIYLFYALPGMSHVAANRYGFPDLEMSVVVLAALGADAILLGAIRRQRTRLALMATAGAGLVASTPAWGAGGGWWLAASLIWGALTLVLVAAAASRPWSALGRVVLIGVIPLEALAMFVVPELSSPLSGHIDVALVKFLDTTTASSGYRFFTLGPLQPDYGSYFGLGSINTNDLPDPAAFNHLVTSQLDPRANAVTFTGTDGPTALVQNLGAYENLGVKFVVAPRGLALPWQLVYQDRLASVYELPKARPFYAASYSPCSTVDWTIDRLTIDCLGLAIVVRDELYMPGWSAKVNGVSEPVVAAPWSLQAVLVPPGRSTVSFHFEPPYISYAVGAAGVGALACAVPACGSLGAFVRRRAGLSARMRRERRRLGRSAVAPPARRW